MPEERANGGLEGGGGSPHAALLGGEGEAWQVRWGGRGMGLLPAACDSN